MRGHLVDGILVVLDHQAGFLHPQILDRPRRRLTRFRMEKTAELSRAQVRDLCQFFHRKRASQVLFRVSEDVLDTVGFRFQFQERRVLGLSPVPAMVDDEFFGN